MCPSEERGENNSSDALESMLEDQCKAWRSEQHFGAKYAAKDLLGAGNFHWRRCDPPARRR